MDHHKLVLPEFLNHHGFLFGGYLLKWIDEDSQKLVCLHHGILEGIENNPDPQQVLREIFRQTACKALIHKRKAMNAESILVSSPPERIE